MLYHSSKSFIIALVFVCLQMFFPQGQVRVGFYSKICPNAEKTVMSVVKEAMAVNPRVLPELLRLHFHDCFVEGCDGSILIDNVKDPEKNAFSHQGVGGFEEVAKAKATLENQCPGIVSCADIVALAARDATFLAGGPFYQVETGRRDGRVSNLALAADMPDVNDPIETLISKFKKKQLSEKELVLLNGAHTIGTTACFFMTKRLYHFSGRDDSDPDINPSFKSNLTKQCPVNGDINVRIPLDPISSQRFDDQLLRNIKNGVAVIASDARLYNDNVTKQVIDSYFEAPRGNQGSSFAEDFGRAMVKMGRIGVKTRSEGEIRRVCNSFN